MKLSPIIEISELLKIRSNPDLKIFDASNSKNSKINYKNEHLEGAIFVDANTHLASIKNDLACGGRHPLPDPKDFSKTITSLGISKDCHIVVYDDSHGSNAAARFWWMLKSAGHQKVQVLNGGLNQAKLQHFPVSSGVENPKESVPNYEFQHWTLPTIEMNEVEKISTNSQFLLIDVRSKERFEGKSEPIDLVAGHIPGAINLPFTQNLNENGFFLSPKALKNNYEKLLKGINPENVIVHCGSGVTACHTILAFEIAELKIPKLYVGSWSEWSRNGKLIEKTFA